MFEKKKKKAAAQRHRNPSLTRLLLQSFFKVQLNQTDVNLEISRESEGFYLGGFLMSERQPITDPQSAGEAEERLLNLQRCLLYYTADLFYCVAASKPFTRKQLHAHTTGQKKD